MTLTSSEIAQMRTDLEKLLPSACIIYTTSYAADGGGESTATYNPAGTVACRIDPMEGTEMVTGGAVQPYHRYMLTLPHGATIVPSQRVKVSGEGYNVISVTAADSWKLDTRCEVERIT